MKTFVDSSIWTERDARGVDLIGFRQSYIDQVLGECFHVVQADTKKARKGSPLMVLETNDGTNRVRSPVTGTIIRFSDKARNFPDRLTEDDVIVEVLPEGAILPTSAKVRANSEPMIEQAVVRPLINMNVGPFANQQAINGFEWGQQGGVQANRVREVPANQEELRRLGEVRRVAEVQARNALAANRPARGARRPR